MELFMRNIPYAVDELQLNRVLAPVLHGHHFRPYMGGAPYNFMVRLFKAKNRKQKQHSGCGILVVPSVVIGTHIVTLARTGAFVVHGRRLYIEAGREAAKREDLAALSEPYKDPETVEAEQRHNAEISGAVPLRGLQFGWLCQDGVLSIEWESRSDQWWLQFDPESRSFRIKSQSGLIVAVALNNVQSLALDSHACACVLALERPPIFEAEKVRKQNELDELEDLFGGMELEQHESGPTRDRLTTLDVSRGNVFAFLRTVRVVFPERQSLREFQNKAKMVGVTAYEGGNEISRRGLFDPTTLRRFRAWLQSTPFDIAFQIDGLVSRCSFNPDELLRTMPAINEAINTYGEAVLSDSIRLLEQRRDDDEDGLPAAALFTSILHDLERDHTRTSLRQSNQTGEIFHCHRVTVTPTSLVLTGPLPDETNRVLRRYMNFQSNFIRVEFRDEDRLHLRLDREVDSSNFIDGRIGKVLQEGLVIAGRRFEFLAYSSSALKEHAVWFISQFAGEGGQVTAESIRRSLGNFSQVIYCPARYGARIAQAFSSTEPSITAEPEEMFTIRDRKSLSGSLFTDGVGTMSLEIAEEIWESFTETRSKRSRRRLQTPSAFQIRLGGFKGMLCVDEKLEGRIICTRPSMSKFTTPDLEVEIARAFDRPMTMYLNRPLIMLLETLGVPLEPFLELQDSAVKETVAASKSMESASRLLEQHGLGTAFRMTSVLLNLHKLHADLESTREDNHFISFLKRMLKFAVNHVLRDLKYKARIPVPNAWTLVGVADEYDYLQENEIFAYVCTIDGKKEYITGPVMISRSPTVHPGDARMVRAIGAPRHDTPAGLGRITNCVVFSCKGERSLPSMLAGGDLDGDIYCLVMDERLRLRKEYQPASYAAPELVKLSRPSTASDIAQFVVDFIKNDLLGVIATQILLTADISPECMADPDCIRLAALHSDAVDFPKTGRHVSFTQLPRPKNKGKPDWYASETNQRKTGFYDSTRIIGELFRKIYLPAIPEAQKVARRQRRTIDEYYDVETEAVLDVYQRNDGLISQLVKRRIDECVDVDHHSRGDIDGEIKEMLGIFERYGAELSYTCRTHSLVKSTALTEEEVVAGTIVAKCSQPRMRADTISAMRRDATSLTAVVREAIEGPESTPHEDAVLRAWTAWKVSVASGDVFGARSFGLIALDVIFNTVRKIDTNAPY